ncbi:MAG TPA: hypothetical protein VLT87_11195 [Thermoanaerobaculia bacterium]|nr:hypothetical protein [Thermoanaerobaculia bacterium]
MREPLLKPVRPPKVRKPLKRTTKLAPRKPMKRTSALEHGRLRSRKKIKKSNPERKAKKYERNFGSHADFIRSLGCAVEECPNASQAAHVVSRKMGGCGGDRFDLVPLCGEHHPRQERYRHNPEGRLTAFEVEHGLNLRALRRALVVADPGEKPEVQIVAWGLLHQEHDEKAIKNALQRGLDLTGREIAPPTIAVEEI